jgi:transcriptional regulator with XRE-family HTH domain
MPLASAIFANRVLPQGGTLPTVLGVMQGRERQSLTGPGSPTVRRRELGVLLRSLRTERGWTVEHVAERLLVSPSKVSRLETGQRGASPRDIRDLCDLYTVADDVRQQLLDLAAEGKQLAWWQSRGLPYSTYVGLESGATSISDFALGLIPGLLQTREYALAVLTAIHPRLDATEIEQRLTARLDRQRLLTSPNAPRFDAVIEEAVLHRVAGDRAIMRGQLEHLLTASHLPNVTVRILPYEAGVLPVENNKFIILSFGDAVPGVVFIEGLTGDLYLDSDTDLAAYRAAFDALRGLAASAEDSTALILRIMGTLGS